jgi:hypothetical protein
MQLNGKVRQQSTGESSKYVGLFEAKVIAVNPNAEQYKTLLGIELADDSKATEYLGESKDGNTTLRVDFWMEDNKFNNKFKVTFFLEDKVRKNKNESKTQYINESGATSWAENENMLKPWFVKREFRECHSGEGDLYDFIRVWLGGIDYMDADNCVLIDWKKLMRGNVKDLQEQITGAFSNSFLALATIKSVIKTADDGSSETKQYQSVYKQILPTYVLKQFRLNDYSKQSVIDALNAKAPKDLKIQERWVLGIYGEYGLKDFFILKDMKEYDPLENVMTSDNPVLDEQDADY